MNASEWCAIGKGTIEKLACYLTSHIDSQKSHQPSPRKLVLGIMGTRLKSEYGGALYSAPVKTHIRIHYIFSFLFIINYVSRFFSTCFNCHLLSLFTVSFSQQHNTCISQASFVKVAELSSDNFVNINCSLLQFQ